tara:strand:+ start:24441 stop:25277 length:837 start_codon:yes stop_codon:yes gene_type:complete
LITVKITGGLGNQMFCYAYAKAIQSRGFNVRIDLSLYESYNLHGGYQLDYFFSDLETCIVKNNLINKIFSFFKLKSNIIREEKHGFDAKYLNIDDNNYVVGYFQSEKYFMNIREILLKQFKPNFQISSYAKTLHEKILNEENSCSVHIRRGDYLNIKNQKVYKSLTSKYYINAVTWIEKKHKNIKYFIFSDDIDWVKSNLEFKNATYIENSNKRKPHEDILLMSICNHNIIANSTFSWWGAWLNSNDNKIVLSPKDWFNDVNLELLSRGLNCSNWKLI